jgi:hypothetical protein
MANSIYETVGDGSTTDFQIPYTYLEADDVTAFVGGVSTAFTFTSSNVITFSTAPAALASVRINRNTDVDNLNVTYSDGGALTSSQLNDSNTQLLFGVQEAIDRANESMAVDTTDGAFSASLGGVNRVIKNVANPTNAQDAATKNYVDTADASLVSSAVSQATAAASAQVTTATGNIIPDATKLAIHPIGSQYTLSDGSTTDYSAKHYQSVASAAATAASSSETDAQASEDEAEAWAQKINGEAVTGEGYSSKAWAVGGTGVSNASGGGNAKDWATETSSTADATEYSSKEYAVGAQRRGQASGGSAKDWATYTAGTVDNAGYSAKYWAEAAQASVATFDNKYFGALSSDPTQDPDGSALEAGDIYYSSSSGNMRVYSGTQWEDVAVSTSAFASAGFSIAMSIAL